MLFAVADWIEPLWIVALGALGAVALLLAVYGVLLLAFPKVAAIARTTTLEARSQPLFWGELAVGCGVLFIFSFIPYNTFGDDLKEMKITGLSAVIVLAVILAVWSSSVAIAEELEGRTALTLLSKPVGRRQFLFGKLLGVLGQVFILFIVLGSAYLVAVSFRVAYDAREMSRMGSVAAECRAEVLRIVPGLALAYLETVVLASISVALSTRLAMIPNLIICVAVYATGHLVPLLVQSSMGQLPIVTFIGQLMATVFPVLDNFSVEGAVAGSRDIPWSYVGWTAGYALLYSTLAMLVALLLFEDRDLG